MRGMLFFVPFASTSWEVAEFVGCRLGRWDEGGGWLQSSQKLPLSFDEIGKVYSMYNIMPLFFLNVILMCGSVLAGGQISQQNVVLAISLWQLAAGSREQLSYKSQLLAASSKPGQCLFVWML